jgi:hypothetical protein
MKGLRSAVDIRSASLVRSRGELHSGLAFRASVIRYIYSFKDHRSDAAWYYALLL